MIVVKPILAIKTLDHELVLLYIRVRLLAMAIYVKEIVIITISLVHILFLVIKLATKR